MGFLLEEEDVAGSSISVDEFYIDTLTVDEDWLVTDCFDGFACLNSSKLTFLFFFDFFGLSFLSFFTFKSLFRGSRVEEDAGIITAVRPECLRG